MIYKIFVKHIPLFILGARFFVYLIDVFLKPWTLVTMFPKNRFLLLKH